jgi:hypothetical protein
MRKKESRWRRTGKSINTPASQRSLNCGSASLQVRQYRTQQDSKCEGVVELVVLAEVWGCFV